MPYLPAASSNVRLMLYVSIFVELLRSRPSLAVWLAALAQALLWLLVPSLFYAAPPAELANVLAVGREFQLGTDLGPPLAFWLAEIAYDATAHSVVGVYLLSQVCVVVTYWAVFALGRSIVGPQHAALAVLLMVGVAAFTVPTPDFGPSSSPCRSGRSSCCTIGGRLGRDGAPIGFRSRSRSGSCCSPPMSV